MPARYFFHAPDGRIYGPASAETLRRWEAEGRLRPDSRLRAEGVDDLFHAWSELRDRKEEPEAVPAVASTASAASEKPPVIPPATPFVPLLVPAAPLSEVVAEAFSLTQRAWRPLWFLVLLFQVPGIVFAALAEPVFHATVDPATGALRMNGAGLRRGLPPAADPLPLRRVPRAAPARPAGRAAPSPWPGRGASSPRRRAGCCGPTS